MPLFLKTRTYSSYLLDAAAVRMISIGEAVDCDWPTELALGISMRLWRRGLTS